MKIQEIKELVNQAGFDLIKSENEEDQFYNMVTNGDDPIDSGLILFEVQGSKEIGGSLPLNGCCRMSLSITDLPIIYEKEGVVQFGPFVFYSKLDV